VFVSHEKANNVAVVDPKQDYKIVKWIQTSHRPRDMKFHDNHKQLFVACGDDDVIDVIDVATLSVVDHIPTGASPEMFQLSADDSKLYVSNEEGSSVQEINLADKIISREFSTGAEPEGIAVTPDGKTVYVTSEASDLVHVIDTAAGAVTDDIVERAVGRRVGDRPGHEQGVDDAQIRAAGASFERCHACRHDRDEGRKGGDHRAWPCQSRRLCRHGYKEGQELRARRQAGLGSCAQS
jgi:YVTN family beta-propeller protein